MCEFVENIRGLIELEFGIGATKGQDVVIHHQHLFKFSRADDIMPQSSQKVQPPCAENVVSADEVLLRE